MTEIRHNEVIVHAYHDFNIFKPQKLIFIKFQGVSVAFQFQHKRQ